jgi:hypothetical protein
VEYVYNAAIPENYKMAKLFDTSILFAPNAQRVYQLKKFNSSITSFGIPTL